MRLPLLLARLVGLVRVRRVECELDDEIAGHLEEATSDYLRQGFALEEARRLARRDFGGVAQVHQVHREMRSLTWLDDLLRDAAYALRTLSRSPIYALATIATLSLAIGAATAVFSVVDAVLMRPLPLASPDRLAMLWTEDPAQGRREGRSARWDVEQWRQRSASFVDFATYDTVGAILTGSEGAEPVDSASISPNLLTLLGVAPDIGRGFTADEAERGVRLVLISHRFWIERFGGARAAVGRTVTIDGLPSEIVGVLPADFRIGRFTADIWQAHPAPRATRDSQTWFVIGRLRDGVTVARAQAEMTNLAPALNQDLSLAERTQRIAVVPFREHAVDPQVRVGLQAIAGAVLCVLAIAVANVINLALARAVARTREMAVRTALGASRTRLVRQILTETLVLSATAWCLGLVLAALAIRGVQAFDPANLPRLEQATLDAHMLGWSAAISLLIACLLALGPTIASARRGDLRTAADEQARSVSQGTAGRQARQALVVAEFALAIVLLVGAGAIVRSWWLVSNVDPGFVPGAVAVMDVSVRPSLDAPALRADFYRRVLDQVASIPAVEHVGLAGDFFTSNPREQWLAADDVDGAVPFRLRLTRDEVSSGLFATLGTPIVRGRTFSDADHADAPPVVIINDALARRLWPHADPIGRRIAFGPPGSATWHTVVGVVGDMRRQGPERDALPQAFVPFTQAAPPRSVDVFVRTSAASPIAVASAMRAAVRRVDSEAPLADVAALEQQFASYLVQRRFQTWLLSACAVIALVMATVGIYGVVQFSVALRRREIGLRLALGAQHRNIIGMVIFEGLTLSLTGGVIGLAGAWWARRATAGLFFGVSATDPWTLAAVSLLLAIVAIVASYVPARRVLRRNPLTALRSP